MAGSSSHLDITPTPGIGLRRTCWIDGCPLPATMCQIDHADNWSTGGLTDLKLLGPACQFHNRDRYRHPDRYTRRKAGTDRWAFTYHTPIRARRLCE